MRDGHDVQGAGLFPVVERERKSIKEDAAGSAAGWKSTCIQPIEQPLPNLLPRDALDRSSVEFGHAFLDLGGPGRFDIRVRVSFERFD